MKPINETGEVQYVRFSLVYRIRMAWRNYWAARWMRKYYKG